jgi:hypothetical protein
MSLDLGGSLWRGKPNIHRRHFFGTNLYVTDVKSAA